jgi:hypothetical protein
VLKISGEIPANLKNTPFSLKINGVSPVILSKSVDFGFFGAVNRNISAYNGTLSFLYIH